MGFGIPHTLFHHYKSNIILILCLAQKFTVHVKIVRRNGNRSGYQTRTDDLVCVRLDLAKLFN